MRELLVDTNVVSELMKPRPDPVVIDFMRVAMDAWYSVITIEELRFGVVAANASRKRDEAEAALERFRVFHSARLLLVTEEIANRSGYLRANEKRAGRVLWLADSLIAATAITYNLVLVTRNTKDFSDLGVHLIDPWKRR